MLATLMRSRYVRRALVAALADLGLSRLAASGEPSVLYLHPWEIDPDQPRQAVGWRVRVNHYHNLGRMESRLRQLLEGFPRCRNEATSRSGFTWKR